MLKYWWVTIMGVCVGCMPEHAGDLDAAKPHVVADATTDSGVLDAAMNPDANQADRETLDTAVADASLDDRQNQDAAPVDGAASDTLASDHNQANDSGSTSSDAVSADASSSDTTTNPDASIPDTVGTDTWVNPYCQPEGISQASVSIAPLIDDWERSPIILFGESDVRIASFLFVASGENINLCTLTFELCASGETNSSGQCSSPANEQQRYPYMGSNFRLEYEDDTGTTQETTTTLNGNKLVFPGVNVYAPRDSQSVVRLYFNAPDSDAGVPSGDQLRVNLVYGSGDLIMIGRSTLGLVSVPSQKTYRTFPTMEFRRSKPRLSRTSVEYATPNLGWNRIITLMINAENTGGLTMDSFLFESQTINNSGGDWNRCQSMGQGSRWRMVDANNTSQILSDEADWHFFNADGQPCLNNQLVAFVEVDLKNDTTTGSVEIAAGETRELTVQLDMTTNGPLDYVRLELLNEEAADLIRLNPGAFSAVTWSDLEAENINAQYLEELPLYGSVAIID